MSEYRKGFIDGRIDAVEDFTAFLADAYDKGMRMSVALAKTIEEKRMITSVYKDFINSLPLNVAAFKQMEEGKRKVMKKAEIRKMLIDVIYESDDKRTCSADFCEAECDINENPVNKCRRCAERILDEYEEAIRKEVLSEGVKTDGH